MERVGGAICLEEAGLSADQLWGEVQGLLWDPEMLGRMRQTLRSQGGGAAVDRLARLVQVVARKG